MREPRWEKLFDALFLIGVHCEIDTLVFVLTGIADELVKYTALVGAVCIMTWLIHGMRDTQEDHQEESKW